MQILIIECFHSRDQHLCKFIGTKESVCIRKEFNSHRTGLGHQHGRRFIVLGHQYDRRDVMWKHSIRRSEPKAVLSLQLAAITNTVMKWNNVGFSLFYLFVTCSVQIFFNTKLSPFTTLVLCSLEEQVFFETFSNTSRGKTNSQKKNRFKT